MLSATLAVIVRALFSLLSPTNLSQFKPFFPLLHSSETSTIDPSRTHTTNHGSKLAKTSAADVRNGIEAIHLPSPKADPAPVKEFLLYCRIWGDSVDHHDAEEQVSFPAVEKLAGKPEPMEGNMNPLAQIISILRIQRIEVVPFVAFISLLL